MKNNFLYLLLFCCFVNTGYAKNDIYHQPFRQLEEILPTPNSYRNGAGAPGHAYWQQRANYRIEVTLDENDKTITGTENIRYENHSPDALNYLWLQLENNNYHARSSGALTETAPLREEFSYKTYGGLLEYEKFDGQVRIDKILDAQGKPMKYTLINTMLRIDLPEALQPGGQIEFRVDWHFNILDAKTIRARTGYEFFEKDGNHIFEIAHWYPRMVAYTDVNGWQNKPFIGYGEFTLELGDYDVKITVPADHIVAATGTLENRDQVLTSAQRKRLKQSDKAKQPVFIVTPQEALANQATKSKKQKTWHFKAANVRDFAFASSRKFIWDAQGYRQGGQTISAMSFYPNEAQPLWSQYSTHAIIHTLEVYSRFTFDYPYPVAQSVNGAVGGMEYPMISFNQPRPEEDKTYYGENDEKRPWEHSKYGLISVIIHEVGHNYFPMIVNSDERQWTWMDEGLNTFLQFIAEQEWEEDYPSLRGEPKDIVEYMLSENQVPIMTDSESLLQFGNNAYAKPATALNILRESILGRELFDFAFQQYARQWKFKRPMPADLFRTLEDASGVDLDWFWRGWFYTTDHVDIAIKNIELWQMDTRNPKIDKAARKKDEDEQPKTLSQQRFAKIEKRLDRFPELKDFYNSFDQYAVTPTDRKEYQELLDELEKDEQELLGVKRNLYVINFKNLGGLVMPLVLDIRYRDGDREILRIPAEIWRRNDKQAQKLLVTKKELTSVRLDPYLESADTDIENNFWPPRLIKSRFQLFKEETEDSPMRRVNKEREEDAKTKNKKD